MSVIVPWPKRLKDLGRADGRAVRAAKARLKREVSNGIGTAPAGTIGTVRSSGNGWNLLRFEADPCPCCGIQWACSRLSNKDMDLIEDPAA